MSEMCARLHRLFQRQPLLRFPIDDTAIPPNGIYILFETGEVAHGAHRIVRVGTHTGNDQLRSRLRQHFVKEHKDRSIFRKNIGRALLNRDNDPFLAQWEIDLTTSGAKKRYGPTMDFARQAKIERQVTERIQEFFQFAVFGVEDKATRLKLESMIISTISRCDECGPSQQWLGLHSPKSKIRESGLWLVNELYRSPLSESEYIELAKRLTSA